MDVGGGVGELNLCSQQNQNQFVLITYVGGFDIQLSRLYPKLKFVIQDRGPVLEQGEHAVWPKENPQALADGRVRFMQHDFFDVNPVKDADVYWLRYIM